MHWLPQWRQLPRLLRLRPLNENSVSDAYGVFVSSFKKCSSQHTASKSALPPGDQFRAMKSSSICSNASVEIPVEDGTACNVIVNGSYGNVTFRDAVLQANWYEDEGWVLEAYPGFEGLNVTYWLPVPPLPEKG